MHAATYPATIAAPRRLRRALRRRPTAADRLRAALARVLARAAEIVAPAPTPRRATDLWND